MRAHYANVDGSALDEYVPVIVCTLDSSLTVKVVGAASGHAGIVKASCVEGAGGARF